MSAKSTPPEALDMVERAIFLLRSRSAGVWSVYAAGATPLLLSILWFFLRNATDDADPTGLVPGALLCAASFLWFNVWRARFAQLLMSALTDQQPERWQRTLDPIHLAAQSGKLFVMPLASLALIPLGWVTAFFRSLTIFAGPNSFARAVKMSTVWQRQTWSILLTLALFSLVVFANIFIFVAILPGMLKIFTGIENDFTRLGFTFDRAVVAVAIGVTWLLVDPLYQAVFCVRAYLAESRETGLDLKFALRHLALVFVMAAAVLPQTAHAQTKPPTAQELQASVQRALHQPEYNWHAPREQDTKPGFFNGIFEPLRKAYRTVSRWIGNLIDGIFRGDESPEPAGKPKAFPAAKWTIFALLALFVIAVALALLRMTRARTAPPAGVPGATPVAIQLDDEKISAADLPEDRWIELGRDCLTRGDYRLAMRAFYLANLSWLGHRGLLTIAPFKSNRDYWRELRRRTPSETLQADFARNMRAFERGWYGTHAVDAGQVIEFEQTFLRMREQAGA